MDNIFLKSENYTAEDIRIVIRHATVKAMNAKQNISTKKILEALQEVKPSLNDKLVKFYKNKRALS